MMESLKAFTSQARDGVQQSMVQAHRWEQLGGPNELTTQYAQTSQDLMTYPITVQQIMDGRHQLERYYKDQANKTCMELERLLAMNYMQKARLENEATKDNWARDALRIVEANIRVLTTSHDQVLLAARGMHY